MVAIFRVGVAEIDITPPAGLLMDGYIARSTPSSGTHDPLLAQVLVIADDSGQHRAAIVALDTLAITGVVATDLRGVLAQVIDTVQDAIFIAASHTHAAPRGLQTWFPAGSVNAPDQTLLALLRDRLYEAARTAIERLTPARMVYSTGDTAGVSGDRNRPDSAVDSRLTALAFDTNTGERLAVIAHYACHPTVLGADNTLYSADFPGALRRHVQTAYPGAICLYLNGAAGNISTRYTRHAQTFAEVERIGGILGDHVVKLLHNAVSSATQSIHWAASRVDLPLRTFATADQNSMSSPHDSRQIQVRTEGKQLETELARVFAGQSTIAAHIHTLRLGDWALVGVPGEPFAALATAIRAVYPFALLVGYANDYLGYFPTQDAINSGTYEALSSPYDHRAHEMLYCTISKFNSR